jgi:hypothetical protein
MIEGEGPGARRHIPAEQGNPEQVLVLRRPGGLRQQRQHEHEQRHRPHPQASGQQHRPCDLYNDRRPAGLDELDQVTARQHFRCEERLCQREPHQQIDQRAASRRTTPLAASSAAS